MKKIVVLLSLLSIVGCRNLSTYDIKYDKSGKVVSAKGTLYESKFTHKNVNIITDCTVFKVTTGAQADSAIPSVSMGWFWTALLELGLYSDGELCFYKKTYNLISDKPAGETFLYIRNGTKTKQNIKVESRPRYFLDLPFFKIGVGPNKTKVIITPDKKNSKPPYILTKTTGGNEIEVVNITKK